MFSSRGLVCSLLIVGCACLSIAAQDKRSQPGTPVLWEQVNVPARDVYWGAGGQAMFPDVKRLRFIGRDTGGNNPKYEIADKHGNRWIVKIADESQPEIAASRLLWAIGYKTEVDYIIPAITLPNVGNYRNVRIEFRPKNVKRGERWSWADNPFRDRPEFDGLRIMMAMINNWDLKDENTITLERDGQLHYLVSDLGASFGKLADRSMSRAGRSVGDPEDYAKANFIRGVNNGIIDFDYRGINENVIQGIRVEHGRWLADLLLQLSDRQIADAFRAANYDKEEVEIYSRAFKSRIAALDQATRTATARN